MQHLPPNLAADPLNLPPALAELAERELGETPERRQSALSELRSRISQLPEVDRLADVSDQNLIRFVRGRKYDLDRALETTVEVQRFNTKHPEWVTNLRAAEFQRFTSFWQVLPQLDTHGRLVVILRPKRGIANFSKKFVRENPNSMIRSNLWFFERLTRSPHVQICGVVIANTFNQITLTDEINLSSIAPMSHQLATFSFVSKCLAVRMAGCFIFEEPLFMRIVWRLARPFVSTALKERFHICGKRFQGLHELIGNPDILPEVVGGKLSEEAAYDWVAEQGEQEALEEGIRSRASNSAMPSAS